MRANTMHRSYCDGDDCSGQALLHLVDRVYAAAAAETAWEATLEDIRHAGRLEGVALVAVDRGKRRPTLLASVGPGEARQAGRRLDPPPANPLHTDAVLGSKPGAVWLDHEVMAPALWRETAFASNWMRPQGLVTWACVILASDAERSILLEVYGGAADAATGARIFGLLSRLAPHLLRAWRLGGTHEPGAVGEAAPPDGRRGTAMAELSPDCRLRAVFGLTRAEARLALHLASGGSLASAAATFGVRLSTLRSQLMQVYGKTSTNRQVELVALLHRSALALSGTWADTQNRLSA